MIIRGADISAGVELVPFILPAETTLEAGEAGADCASVTVFGGLGLLVSVVGAGVGTGASEDALVPATSGGKFKFVVAVGTPLASTWTEVMSGAVTWTVTWCPRSEREVSGLWCCYRS